MELRKMESSASLQVIAGICVFVYFTVTNTLEAPGTGQPRPKASNAGEHIKIANQIMNHLLFDEKAPAGWLVLVV